MEVCAIGHLSLFNFLFTRTDMKSHLNVVWNYNPLTLAYGNLDNTNCLDFRDIEYFAELFRTQ